jgi:hypothetical protein
MAVDVRCFPARGTESATLSPDIRESACGAVAIAEREGMPRRLATDGASLDAVSAAAAILFTKATLT